MRRISEIGMRQQEEDERRRRLKEAAKVFLRTQEEGRDPQAAIEEFLRQNEEAQAEGEATE